MADQAAPLHVAGVGMRVEVDDRDPSPADDARDSGHIGPSDGVVPAEDDRNGPRLGRDPDCVLEVVQRQALLHARHLDVASVQHPEVLQRIDPEGEVRARRIVRQVVGGPDHLWTEPSPTSIRRTGVVGRSDDDRVRAFEGLRLIKVAALDPEKCDVGPEHASHPWHRTEL